LIAVLALGNDAYGATIMKHLSKVTEREWSIGAIYDPLYRLEKNGYIKSETTAPLAERGGRSKRLYKVTKFGKDALHKHQNIRKTLSAGITDFA